MQAITVERLLFLFLLRERGENTKRNVEREKSEREKRKLKRFRDSIECVTISPKNKSEKRRPVISVSDAK